MLRVVLDTCILVSALRSREGASYALLNKVAHRQLIPLLTTSLCLEYEAVLKRPEQQVVHGLTIQDIDGFLAAFISASEAVEVHYSWRPQLPDTNDELVLEAAVNGRADALVTHNIKDFAVAMQGFNLKVLTPGQIVKEIRT